MAHWSKPPEDRALETGAYANPAQAALALRRALAGDPGNRTFQLGLIELYRGLGRLEEARALAESVQAAEHPEGRRLLALVYAELGATGPLLDLARAGAEDLAALAGTHATAAGRWETGVALLGLALERDPGDFASGLTLGKALVHAHRLAESRDHLARLLARPWPEPSRARAGFLLVPASPALILAGLATGIRWAALPGLAALALGLPWMFYFKPLLRPKAKAPAPAWQRLTLHGTRLLAMAALAALLGAAGTGAPQPRGALAAFLVLALALHIHHLKAWKGRNAQLAGLAAWGLSLAAWLGLR